MLKDRELNEHISMTMKLVSDGVRKFGVKKFNKTLVSVIVSDEFSNNNYTELIDFIITCVLDEFRAYRITKEDIFETKKRGEVTVARKMAVIVIKSNLKISDRKLAGYFGGRCRQVIYNILREYSQLDIQNKLDQKFIERYYRVDDKVKRQLLTLNISTNE